MNCTMNIEFVGDRGGLLTHCDVCLNLSSMFAALSRVYHASGAKVILAARNSHELERVKGQLNSVQVSGYTQLMYKIIRMFYSRDVHLQ